MEAQANLRCNPNLQVGFLEQASHSGSRPWRIVFPGCRREARQGSWRKQRANTGRTSPRGFPLGAGKQEVAGTHCGNTLEFAGLFCSLLARSHTRGRR